MRLKPVIYAITILIYGRQRICRRTANAVMMIATFLRYRNQGGFRLHAFVIMPDHIHVLITSTESNARAIQFIKGGFSHAVREQYVGEVWHSGHHEHRIQDRNEFESQKKHNQQPQPQRLPKLSTHSLPPSRST